MIQETIIPAVAFLRTKYPIGWNVLFTESFMATAGCSSASPLNCTDIEGSDRLFDSFYYEYVNLSSCARNYADLSKNVCKAS